MSESPEKLGQCCFAENSQTSEDTNMSPDIIDPSELSVTSSDPSPIALTLGELLKKQNISNLEHEDVVRVLNVAIPQVQNLNGVSEENLNRMAHLLGSQFCPEVKSEANSMRGTHPRDGESFCASELLDKEHKIEGLHIFFEAATKKSGRKPGPNREKIASIQANFYESILKGANLCAVGPYNLMKTNEVLSKVQSKVVLKGNIGGSYTYHQKLSVTEPLPVKKKGPVISDNAQKGHNNYQHFGHGKLDRTAPVTVLTHNIRVESLCDKDDNEIFREKNVSPFNNEHHPVFRPVGKNFLEVVEARVEKAAKLGRQARNTVLQTMIEDIDNDRKLGAGKTSHEKVSEQMDFGTGRKVCCQKCHKLYQYRVETHNICPNPECENNPTYYSDQELGPYRKYNFPLKPPNTVIVQEQEPLPINPNGKENLKKLYQELKSTYWEGFESFPFYGDGLPGITYERMKSESVQCSTHEINIPLKNSELLAEHCNQTCILGNHHKIIGNLFGF